MSIQRTEVGDLVVYHGKEFGNELNEAISKGLKESLENSNHETIVPYGSRVIENEEQVKELIAEQNAEAEKYQKLSPKEKILEGQKVVADAFNKMDVAWDTLSRKGKRKLLTPNKNFSSKIKQQLNSIYKRK